MSKYDEYKNGILCPICHTVKSIDQLKCDKCKQLKLNERDDCHGEGYHYRGKQK